MVKTRFKSVFYFASLFILFSIQQSIAQVYHLGRYETPFNYITKDFRVISNGDNGFLVVASKRIEKSDEYIAEFTHFNSNFQIEWVDSLRLSKLFYIKGADYDGSTNYLLLQDVAEQDDLKIITVNPQSKQVNELDQRRLTSIRVTDFTVIKNSAIIVGYINLRPSAFIYDMKSKTLKTLNQVYQNKSDILELKVNEDGVSFNILVSVLDDKNDRTIQLNTYDYEGNLIRDYRLETDPDYQLINGVSSSIYDIEQVTTGLYGFRAGTSPSGFYVNHVNRTGEQTMKYIPFGQFDSFFDHEGERRAQKLKRKSLKQNSSDKPYRYNTEAIFQPMIEEDGQLTVLTEFFEPWNAPFQRVSVQSKNNDRPRTTWKSNVLLAHGGVNFTHSFMLKLDLKGNVIKDRSIRIKEDMRGRLNNFGTFNKDQDEIYYAFYYLEKFRVQKLNSQSPLLEVKLKLPNDSDQLRVENEYFGDVLKWTNGNYLVYGIQHIRDENNPTELRKVYFINGLAIRPNFLGSDID